jgi:hypothetical protein
VEDSLARLPQPASLDSSGTAGIAGRRPLVEPAARVGEA